MISHSLNTGDVYSKKVVSVFVSVTAGDRVLRNGLIRH